MQKITPCFWFEDDPTQAVNFYVSLFPNSKIGRISRYDKASAEVSGRPEGSVLTIEFSLNGQEFMALNGGKVPGFELNSGVSFVINCENQEEVDKYWAALSSVPEAEQCGWAKDKFGITWQIVPTILTEYLNDPDKGKASRVMQAMLEMKKIIIRDLEVAYGK